MRIFKFIKPLFYKNRSLLTSDFCFGLQSPALRPVFHKFPVQMIRGIIPILVIIVLIRCSGGSDHNSSYVIDNDEYITDSGMVASAHVESSRIGVQILKQGGNAIDAAVATEFALAVCYPEAGNIGGGGFMLIRLKDSKTDVIDYREKAPLNAFRDMFLNEKGDVIEGLSTYTHLASGVPGTVDGMFYAHLKYGKLTFKDVIQPAIDLAENGFHLTAGQANDFNSCRQDFLDRNLSRPVFVKDSLWEAGDLFIQKDLASVLKRIRDHGRNGFYSGTTARLILKEMKRGNGLISQKDLNDYRSVSRVPLSTDYKGYNIITIPPPSAGGIILLQLLEMVEPFPLEKWGLNSFKTIHLITEAEKRVFADRSQYPGDPEYITIKPEHLLDKDYLIDRMRTFNGKKASLPGEIRPGSPIGYVSEETTHYSVIDYEGNAVSATTTLNGLFGNCIVVDSAGFLLNNQMDDFSLKPGFPNMYGLVGGEANSVQPGKRMLSSMTPSIVEKNGKLFLAVGSPGGSTIPTTVFQVILNVIDFKMNIREAVDAARFHHQWLPDYISYEENAIDSVTLSQLISAGHFLKVRTSLGRINSIMVTSEGKKAAGSDKRGNNSSIGY